MENTFKKNSKKTQRTRRFYIPNLACGDITLSPEESHHAANVLRLREGMIIDAFDGKGTSATGELIEVHRKHTTVRVEEVMNHEPLRPEICLAFAVPKHKRIDWLLEKATELGAARLVPIIFERSVNVEKLNASKMERWLGHCVSAAKQCGLNYLPQLDGPVALDEFLANTGDGLRIVGDCCDGCKPMCDIMTGSERSVTLLVGPEGGLTDDERKKIAEADFLAARLGDTILRIETAAIALIAAVRTLA